MRSPILGAFGVSRSRTASDSEIYNLFPEIIETKDGKAPGALYMCPGLDLLATAGEGPIRGIHVFEGNLIVVSGATVYSITPTWVVSTLGTITNLTTPVTIIDNGQGGQCAIFDGAAGYLLPGGTPLTGGSIGSGGHLYSVGDDITLAPAGGVGSAPAIVTVTGVSAGAVTSFSVKQGGSYQLLPVAFSQQSTTGSGSGFVLDAPTYGAFSGIFTIDLPFAQSTGCATMIDGFGLIWEAKTNRLWQSAELDLSTWSPLAFAFAQAQPDNGVTMAAIHDELFLIKTGSTEIWGDAGLNPFAFQPIGGGTVLEFGTNAPFSIARAGEVLLFLSANDEGQNIVVEVRGLAPKIVSTQALVTELDTYANTADAIGYSYQQGGHVFYVLTFPQADRTWCYDLTASEMVGYPLWHRRAAFDNGLFHRHWGNAFTRFIGGGVTKTVTSQYCADPVKMAYPEKIQSLAELQGIGASISTAVFSGWFYLPDDAGNHGVIFSNQNDDTGASPNPGLLVVVSNDDTETAQIVIEAWDASNAPIVIAVYLFSNWVTWVNVMVSIDTSTQTIQVYANTIVTGELVESELTSVSLTWISSNPIANLAAQPWHLVEIAK